MLIKKISNDLIDVCINYLHDEENSNKIKENLIDPFIVYIIDKFYPYFIISLSLVLLILRKETPENSYFLIMSPDE